MKGRSADCANGRPSPHEDRRADPLADALRLARCLQSVGPPSRDSVPARTLYSILA
jgi:hypothetical protein